MAIEKKFFGSNTYYVDNQNQLSFTKAEMEKARKRVSEATPEKAIIIK